MFESHKIKGVNTDSLTPGNDYPYITRTSLNNGILGYSGVIENAKINESNSFSVGLLQMDFFLQEKQWYAGQFVRKILPKNEMSKKVLTYFLVHFNKMNKELSSVLVRDFDSKFLNKKIPLPINPQSPTIPNYSLMESYITAIEKLHVNKLISSHNQEITALNTVT